MVKSYLKYEHSKSFGLITSPLANVIWTPDEIASTSSRNTGAGRAIVAANEEIICWDIKKGELLGRWKEANLKAEVTTFAQSKADRDIFAVGYQDGSIRLWDSKISTVIINFNGHRSAVTALDFDDSGVRLVSGAKDTDIIVWDLVAEVGLFKLRGHTDQITGIHFLQPKAVILPDTDGDAVTPPGEYDSREGFLISISKDALIKIWNITSQHCIETHVAQNNGECWALGVSPDDTGCITAGNDGELAFWAIDLAGLRYMSRETAEDAERKFLTKRGVISRQGTERTLGISFHPRSDYFAVHGSEKAIEIWKIHSINEVQKSLARKRKRRREKMAKEGIKQDDTINAMEPPLDMASVDISEVFSLSVIVRTGGKVHSVCWAAGKAGKSLQILAATTNNQLELYHISTKEDQKKVKKNEPLDYSRQFSVDLPGHRTDIRSLALSFDDRMLASASSGCLKIWNVKTNTCIRTFECGYALCCAFLPGDKIVVVGTKSGELEVFDVTSSAILDTIKAHEGSIWALHVHPNGRSVVTGSADKSAKFWNFEVVQEEIPGTKRSSPKLKLAQNRTLKVNDDILSIRFSPDSRLLALALLDNTVKVFFVDSLKLFLNLYGHKLPVLNMDISFDSKLIVTCSADKNIRLWGLDFGDCHRAFFAHQDSIMAVAFVPHNQDDNGHHFFSASKDHSIKYWDGDKFEQIQKLEGHHGEIWSIVVSRMGEFVISASHDKSLRVWEQGDEQIFLEEEKERELEELYEGALTANLGDDEAGNEGTKFEAVAAGKQTVETLMAGEKIAEALDLGIIDLEIMKEWQEAKLSNPKLAPAARDPQFLALNNISAEAYVLSVVQKIKSSSLQDALLVLPFSKVLPLFTFLNIWVSREWSIPLTCRILFFMLKTHHRQIVASKALRQMLVGLRVNLRAALKRNKDEMGFNLAALKYIARQVLENSVSDYVNEESWESGVAKVATKRAFIDVA
ncbi:MAG: hypothetical protein M1829_003452 [Trizodia sp. TS-e1964]|nr:MAG: hypothetical protein M1829_003452 [Trizodia sp. TS-e1964]